MNSLMLKDFHWTEPLIDSACENFISKIIQMTTNQKSFVEINNLDGNLYRWSIDVIINLMVGCPSSLHDQQLNQLVDEFAKTVKHLFETSAKLMSIPPQLADKFHLKIWKDFESCAKNSIELCMIICFVRFPGNFFNLILVFSARKLIYILNNQVKCDDVGLLRKMKAQNINEEMIGRLFADLIIAAGDTVGVLKLLFDLINWHFDNYLLKVGFIKDVRKLGVSRNLDKV